MPMSWTAKEINLEMDRSSRPIEARSFTYFLVTSCRLKDIILLSEDEIKDGIRTVIKETHNLAEGAGAAATAAVIKNKNKIRGKKVVSILSGCNIDSNTLKEIFK